MTQAIILLHGIFGINQHIQNWKDKLEERGFNVYCPNLLEREPFPYEQENEAYQYYYRNIDKKAYYLVDQRLRELKKSYEDIFIMGFGVGGTLAWRFSNHKYCSGIVAIYGSKIRNYIDIVPSVPCLLQFAEADDFDVDSVSDFLAQKDLVISKTYPSSRGFMDEYSEYYQQTFAERVENYIYSYFETFKRQDTGSY